MTEIRSAKPQLLALAEEMRPSWDIEALDRALEAAHRAEWTWPQVLRYVTDLLLKDDAAPYDLTVACRGALGHREVPPAGPPFAAGLVDAYLAGAGKTRQDVAGGRQGAGR